MEINNTLTAENLEQQAIFEAKDTSLSFWGGLGLGILFLAIQIIVFIPVMLIAMPVLGISEMEEAQAIVMPIGLILAFVIGAWIYYKMRGLSTTAFQWKSIFVKLIPLGFLFLFGIQYIIGELMTYLPGYEAMLESYKEIFEGLNPIAMLIAGGLIGPICEEIIFRGVILEGLLKKYNPTKAIIFSALIFGLIHMQPLQVMGTFFAGLILGWIYVKTQSLWGVIVLHVINNVIAFSMGEASTESTRIMIGNDLLYIASFAAAAIVAYLAYRGFQKVNESAITIEESIQA